MTVFFTRRHQNVRELGKKEAKDAPGSSTCPHCGAQTNLIEKYPDKEVYKCSECDATNTYTISPARIKKVKKSPNGPNVIMVRDRSKERVKEDKPSSPTEVEELEESPTVENLNLVRESMLQKKVVEFSYISSKGKKSARRVEPYKLTTDKKGNLVLYAYCLDGEGIRRFTLGSISKLTLSEDEYEPRWNLEDEIDG